MLLAASLDSLEAGLQDPAAGQLPLPVIVQEFVNHGGKLAKVYVAGDKVGGTLLIKPTHIARGSTADPV
jgi:hypothetical protein